MVNSAPTAIYDRAIYGDPRVLANLLFLEPKYTPKRCFGTVQKLVEPYMRKIITTWMLECRSRPRARQSESRYRPFHNKLQNHPNPLVSNLASSSRF
ncbi:unnamed protein product [Nezara viridula]|uniref:Uncharacterized protein n=1 Tax=Nezara viridula TaxID=85310 RepID=A0A9P0HVF0_NEZVI|nr:unnamed protein product [Nezara viridula]